MQSRTLARSTSISLILAGLSLALWTTVHPWGHVDGEHIGRSGQWMLSHSFHFTAGLALLFAVAGLAAQRLGRASRFETAALATAFTGAALFTGTGLFTAYVWPVLAVHSPVLVAADGPLLGVPHPLIPVSALLFSLGLILLAVALLRARVIPFGAAACTVGGAVLLMVPPPPLSASPWPVLVLGGVLSGAGVAWTGWAVRAGAVAAQAAASSAAPAAEPARV